MLNRAFIGIAGVLLAGGLLMPARAQVGAFEILRPASLVAETGSVTVRWRDSLGEVDNGRLPSITWYYSKDREGKGRRRMVSEFHEDFSRGFFRNWRAEGAFQKDWEVLPDPAGAFKYLRGPRDAGPAISTSAFRSDVVISARIRPRNLRSRFSIGARVQQNGHGYELRSAGHRIQVALCGDRQPIDERLSRGLSPNQWYWFELGLRTRKRREVEVRVRVYDDQREEVLASFTTEDLPQNRSLLRDPGLLLLSGNADFAEIYVDPWAARWVHDHQNEFQWNTAVVPDGTYYVIAELADGRGRPQRIVSDFEIEVRNGERAAAN